MKTCAKNLLNLSLIDYLAGKEADSNLTSRIDAKVKEAIAKSLWRKEYMTYKEHMDQEYNRGLEEGRVNTLFSLVQDGLLDIDEASKRANMTVEKFKAGFDEYISTTH
jgi:hypothetical protein